MGQKRYEIQIHRGVMTVLVRKGINKMMNTNKLMIRTNNNEFRFTYVWLK